MLITMLGVFTAAAICDTPVQLDSSSAASLIKAATAPIEVLPVVSIASWAICPITPRVMIASSVVPVMTTL
jgi:hypothetical protein